MMIGIVIGLRVDSAIQEGSAPIVYAKEPEAPKEVLIEVRIDWTKERIIKEIHDVFPDAPIMEKVAWCESRLKADAVGPTEDYGIFQLHDPSHDLSGINVFNPADNIRFARKLYNESGLRPWSASKHCWSK